MSLTDEGDVLSSTLDKYFPILNDDHDDEASLLPHDVSDWLDNSFAQSNDQLSLLMRDLDFDIDLFPSDTVDMNPNELSLCKTNIGFESKMVDKVFERPSSRQSPLSADSGNHSPSSTSSEAVSEVWHLNPMNATSDDMASPSSNAYDVFHKNNLKEDESVISNREDLDAIPSYFKAVEVKEAKDVEEMKPLVKCMPAEASHLPNLATLKQQGLTRLVPVSAPIQQVVATRPQTATTQQPLICILPTSSGSTTIQQQQLRQKYVQNVANPVHLASCGVNEGGCMRNSRSSPGTTNRVQPYLPIRPKVITPKREVCSSPPTVPLIANPVHLQTVGVSAATRTILTPVALARGLRLIECRTAHSTCSSISGSPYTNSGFDEFTRKKEDRKIRNRASAQLSRLRKRNEVDEMKQKLADKDMMIATLQEENEQLRKKVFSLQNENKLLKSNMKRTKVGGRTGVAAGTACVFVILMMVTFSGPMLSRFNPASQTSESFSQHFPLNDFDGSAKTALQQHGRALLSVDYDVDESNDVEEDKRLHVKRNAKQMIGISPTINVSNIADCNETKLYINQTEAIRLNNDLSNWVDRHELLSFLRTRRIFRAPSPKSRPEFLVKNATMTSPDAVRHAKQKAKLTTRMRRSTNDKKEEARLKAVRERAWRHIDMISTGANADAEQPQKKMRDTDKKRAVIDKSYQITSKKTASGFHDGSAFDLFAPHIVELQYMELARVLKHRDDTLYVVAMKDYYLLPATDRNSTMRPRVALILPALSYNGTLANQVPMMRIECEITGTGLFHIAESLLPLFYNQSFYQSVQ